MKIFLRTVLFALVLIGTSTVLQAQDLNRTFPASPDGKLVLDLETGGDIVIRAWNRNEVSFTVEITGRDSDQVTVEFDQSSRAIEVFSEYKTRRARADVNMEIKVPARFNLDVSTTGGDLDISGITGRIEGSSMGGDLVLGGTDKPLPVAEGTDMIGATERLEHVRQCLPEICTLDCGTMNFAEADYVMTNTPGMLRAMGGMITELGVKPEIEAFDTGHLWFAKELVRKGFLKDDALVQLCMGVPWGAPDDLNTFMAMVNNVPTNWTWSAFSLGRNQMPYVAAAVLAGGNVRIGLEDNLMLEKGVFATNAQLVEKAVTIIENMGASVIGPEEVRSRLNLEKRAPLS